MCREYHQDKNKSLKSEVEYKDGLEHGSFIHYDKDGKVERQGTGGGYHYVFKSGEWNYIIENNFMGETTESICIFLKTPNIDTRQLYHIMANLTTCTDYDS